MPIESYLIEGEEILAQAGYFYATNRRLIRYRKHLIGDEWDDIPYTHLSSVGVTRSRGRGWLWAGITIISLVLTSLVTLAIVSPILEALSPLLGTPKGFELGPLVPPHLLGLAIGLALVLVGIFVPSTFIQFRAPGLNKDTEARFRLKGVRQEATLNLLRTIRQQSLIGGRAELAIVRPSENRGNQTTGQ